MARIIHLLFILSCVSLMAAIYTEGFDKNLNGWGHWNPPENKVSYLHDKELGCAAPGSAKILFKEGNSPTKRPVFIRQFPNLEQGEYRITAKCRAIGDGEVNASLTVQAGKMAEKNGKSTWNYRNKLCENKRNLKGEEWQTLSVTFNVAEGIVPQLLPGACGEAGNGCLFDDITLEKIDFTQGYKDSFESNIWSIWKANPKDKIRMIHSETEGHDGPGAIGIEYQESNPDHKSVSLLRRFPVEPGKEYTFLVFVKAVDVPDDMGISLGIQGLDSQNKFLGLPLRSSKTTADQCREWKRLVITFKIPTTGKWAQCAKMLVTMGGRTPEKGFLYFDDFAFIPSDDED